MSKKRESELLGYEAPPTGAVTTMQFTTGVTHDTLNNTVVDGRTFTYTEARLIRKDPTVRLARLLSVAPILAAQWSVENDDDAMPEAVDFVGQFVKFRSWLIKEAAFGMMDYGWRGLEVVWKLDASNRYELDRFISLLPDITKAMPDKDGNFLGFRQEYNGYDGTIHGNEIKGKAKAVLFNQRQEGINFYGESDLEIIQDTKTRYDFANNIAEQYDTKSAGAVWELQYPVGKTMLNGVLTNNDEIARDIMSTIKSNGGICIPSSVQGAIGNLLSGSTANSLSNPNGWAIRMIESTGNSSSHLLSRMQHLETLMVRGIGLPERSLLEGKHGTKADAAVHADVALTSAIDRSDYILGTVNEGPVDAGLVINFGPSQRGQVRLIAEPIGTDEKIFLREVYMRIISGGDTALLDLNNVDMAAIKHICGVPTKTADGTEEDVNDMLLQKTIDDMMNKDTNPNNNPNNNNPVNDTGNE